MISKGKKTQHGINILCQMLARILFQNASKQLTKWLAISIFIIASSYKFQNRSNHNLSRCQQLRFPKCQELYFFNVVVILPMLMTRMLTISVFPMCQLLYFLKCCQVYLPKRLAIILLEDDSNCDDSKCQQIQLSKMLAIIMFKL